MSIKKYTNGSWVSASYHKYGTETDTITTLPTTVIGDGTPISSYTIKGNTEQTGTPTPENPIMPSGCGERTENLYNNADSSMNFFGYINTTTLAVIASTSSSFSIIAPVEPNTTYTIVKPKTSRFRVGLFTSYPYTGKTATAIYGDRDGNGFDYGTSLTVTTSNDTSYILAFIRNFDDSEATVDQMKNSTMVVEGSTAPTSYIPYGYKLPVTLGSTTTNIYLGEVQSTRRIKKLVLTGEETLARASANIFRINLDGYLRELGETIAISTHYTCAPNISSTSDLTNDKEISFLVSSSGNNYMYIRDTSFNSDTDSYKSFLAAQYAAGTPVTVWYVLAEPETGIVNEPIMKIGDYADSVSGTNLATSGTAQELDVGTTLKPSEFDLTYHGWHEHEDTKFTT